MINNSNNNPYKIVQLQKTEETLPDAKEFDNLKDHLEKHLRLNVPPTLPTSFLSFSSSGAFSKMMGSHLHHDSQSQQQGKLDDLGAYEPAVHVPDDDSKLVDNLMSLRTVDQGSLS